MVLSTRSTGMPRSGGSYAPLRTRVRRSGSASSPRWPGCRSPARSVYRSTRQSSGASTCTIAARALLTRLLSSRWSWKNVCLYGLWVALPYCIYANWVWGGGWLAQAGKNLGLGHGAVDFAGSGVVHAMGGIIALAGGLVQAE